jgi:hypothetical protein
VQGLRHLHGELARGREDERHGVAAAPGLQALQHRQGERRCLARAGRRLADQVAPASRQGIASRWIGVGSS